MKQILRLGEGYGFSNIKRSVFYALLIYIVLAWLPDNKAQAQTLINGTVTDSTSNEPLPGVTITINGTNQRTATNSKGEYQISASPGDILIFTAMGYKTLERKAAFPNLYITLETDAAELEEVEVEIGYQSIPKERATGSFVQIDNKLLSRSVGSNILDRLRGVTRGLIFNDVNLGSAGFANQPSMSIRGRSTLEANAEPLIILDNFPYEGDINAINPEDISTVTVLQDAAAASIWGARAGNGVIVLTSKKGKFNQPVQVSVNSNISISEKPDLYYAPTMPINDYIEVERFLFNKGAWDGSIDQVYSYIPPAVESLLAYRNGHIDSLTMESQLAQLKTQDVRPDLLKYIYQSAMLEKLAFNMHGGSAANRHYLSAGYDKNKASIKNNSNDRVSLTARNSYLMLDNKLELDASVVFTKSMNNTGNSPQNQYGTLYNRLADQNGTPLSVGTTITGFRQSYVDTAGHGLLKDWNYRPVDELYSSEFREDRTTYQIQGGISYRPLTWLGGKLSYQYGYGNNDQTLYDSPESYVLRNDFNRYAQINPASGTVNSAIPEGGRLAQLRDNYHNYNFRAQVDVHKSFGSAHQLDGLFGAEWNSRQTLYEVTETWHGYQPETESYTPVDYTSYYPQYYSFDWFMIPGTANASRTTSIDRNRLYFSNISYMYKDKYVLTASLRKDESNLFGVDANNRGKPFWSAGLLWKLSREGFYQLTWLPKLAFRATNGYSGNVSKTASAYVTSYKNENNNVFSPQHPSQTIRNPPNPALTWEKVRMVNIALDFGLIRNIVSGSVEYYRKTATNLLSSVPYHTSSGISSFYGNWSSMKGTGWDISLSSRNLNRELHWNTDLFFSVSTDEVTGYKLRAATDNQYLISNIGSYPIEGKPVYSLFSLAWAGLNNQGQPQGYVNGEISTDYPAIYNNITLEDLVYNGRATPASFGSLRNSFDYKNFNFSFNITFKLGYYFRRQGLSYSTLYNVYNFNAAVFMADYAKRWQQPGDERTTQVPAAVYPANGYSDAFYQYSGALVEKGDHIRLNDLKLGYELKSGWRHLRYAQLYVYINNLGILWRANKQGIDPDMVPGTGMVYPNSTTYALGININL